MEVLYPRCAGLDVHKDTVVACVRRVTAPKVQAVRTFGTTTSELLALSDWLDSWGCTHVAMEATGVYWKPVWHLLEDHFELVLANAQHVRNVPGRKTDVNDAMWIADLLAHGLIRSSFVPPVRIQQLRDLTRTRKQLVREISQHSLRIQKVLETSVVAWIGAEMEFALSQAVASGDTFEHRPSECGHCVQDFLADLDLRDLPGEAAGSESGADDALPPADLRFYPAALVVPCGHLPGHAAVAADLGNMAIPNGWIPRRLRADHCVLRRRYNHIQGLPIPFPQQIPCGRSIIVGIRRRHRLLVFKKHLSPSTNTQIDHTPAPMCSHTTPTLPDPGTRPDAVSVQLADPFDQIRMSPTDAVRCVPTRAARVAANAECS